MSIWIVYKGRKGKIYGELHNFAGKTLGEILGNLGMMVHFGLERSAIVRNFLAIVHRNAM